MFTIDYAPVEHAAASLSLFLLSESAVDANCFVQDGARDLSYAGDSGICNRSDLLTRGCISAAVRRL